MVKYWLQSYMGQIKFNNQLDIMKVTLLDLSTFGFTEWSSYYENQRGFYFLFDLIKYQKI